jgi:hypothetical protein
MDFGMYKWRMEKIMKTFYVTFGLGSPLANILLQISAPSENELRNMLVSTTKMWCSIKTIEEGFNPTEYCAKYGCVLILSPDFNDLGN